MRIIRDTPPVGWLYSIEHGLAAGTEAAREMVDCDGGRQLAQDIMDRDPAARAEFASVAELAGYLRERRHASRGVPTVSAPSATTTTAARAEDDAPPPPPPPTRRPTAQGQPLGQRMPLPELLSRAGAPRFSAVAGSAAASTALANFERMFKVLNLDPVVTGPLDLSVDRARAMAMLASLPSDDLLHVLAV